MDQRIGIVGLGLVGTALAQRLRQAGVTAAGYDLDPGRLDAFAAAGGRPAASAADVGRGCDVLLLSLPDADVVARVVDGLGAAGALPRFVVDTTTGDPDAVAAIAASLSARGCGYLDATISGSSQQLRDGEAVLMVGGDDATVAACRPLLEGLSPQVVHVGPPGSGSRAKLASNLVLGLNRLALAEGLVFAEALGLDPAAFLDLLVRTPAYSRQMDSKGPKMVRGDFAPVARLAQHRKDVGLILAAADRAGLTLPLSCLHASLLTAAVAAGDGDLDNSAVIRQLRRAGAAGTGGA